MRPGCSPSSRCSPSRARVGRGARALAQPRRLIARRQKRRELSGLFSRAVRTWRPGAPHHPVMEVRMRHAFVAVMWVAVSAGVASAQSVIQPPPFTKSVNLSGPRFGLTALSTGVVDELARAQHRRRSEHLAVRLAVREAVLHPRERGGGGERMGGPARGARPGRGAAQRELAGGSAHPRRGGVRHRPQHHAGRRRARPCRRGDVPAPAISTCR